MRDEVGYTLRRKVCRIIDGDTFEVSEPWVWRSRTGTKIRPKGYDTPEVDEPGYEEAKRRLNDLILNEIVEITPLRFSFNRLLAIVTYKGKDLADYFPEYKFK